MPQLDSHCDIAHLPKTVLSIFSQVWRNILFLFVFVCVCVCFFFSRFHCSPEVLMTLEFYAKDVRFIIILHLFIVIFNTNGWDLKEHRCSRLVKQFTKIKFFFILSKIKIQTTNLQWSISIQIYAAPVIVVSPNNNFFLFYFVFIGMLQGSSQVSGSTRISLIGMWINSLFNWLHEAAMIVTWSDHIVWLLSHVLLVIIAVSQFL